MVGEGTYYGEREREREACFRPNYTICVTDPNEVRAGVLSLLHYKSKCRESVVEECECENCVYLVLVIFLIKERQTALLLMCSIIIIYFYFYYYYYYLAVYYYYYYYYY